MEIKRFVEVYYDQNEETIFVKEGNDKYIISFSYEDGGQHYDGEIIKNGEIIASGWNDTIRKYHEMGLTDAPIFMANHHEDDEEEEKYDKALEEARKEFK